MERSDKELSNTLMLAGAVCVGVALVVWVLFGVGAKVALMLGVLAAAVVLMAVLWRGTHDAPARREGRIAAPEKPAAAEPEPDTANAPEPPEDPKPAPVEEKPTADDILTGQRASEAAFNAPLTEPDGADNDARKPATLDSARNDAPDDLKKIKGVGPKLEALLNELGYFHFDQIAGWSAAEVAWVDENLKGFKGRVSRDNWVAQAADLARAD